MSTLKVDNIRHNSATSDAITMASDGTCTAKITGMTGGGGLSHRNLFVNGACQIGQRGSTSLGSGYGGVDRWVQFIGSGGVTTTSQDTDAPTGQGFRKSIKLDVTTAVASGSSNWAWLGQYIEAKDCQSVCKGTSNAKQLTLQFWVKSPKTGTHTVRLDVQDSSDGVGATYTVSSANTWEKKTVTFPASTSGTINDDNGRGIHVLWVLSAGTTYSSGTLNTTWASWTNANTAPGQPNILDSTSNNFYLTGVQLEVGDTATTFEHRSFGEELSLCYRYYYKLGKLDYIGQHMSAGEQYCIGMSDNDDLNIYGMINFPVFMRTPPTGIDATSAGNYRVRRDTTQTCTGVPTFIDAAHHYCRVNFPKSGHGWGTGQMLWCQSGGSGSYLGFSAEL